jgi:aspartate/methionine/tyrosine aminotransferase
LFVSFILLNILIIKIVSFEPGWDYAGVYQSLDMKIIHLPLTPENNFEPDLNQWNKHLKQENVNKIDLVIINTQHNPT